MKTLLVIGHTFPEPSTTAAGVRMMQLIQLFQAHAFQITFASTAVISEKSADLKKSGILIEHCKLNDSSFDEFVKKLQPDIVLFDRFLTEEQFGWRISEQCPETLKILDTEDLHFLRKAREEAVKKGKSVSEADIYSDLTKRELASIFRCDLSLMISEYEMELLKNEFRIPEEILHYLPFLIENTAHAEIGLPFENRKHFVVIGNLLHSPNVDAVLELKKLWKSIRKKLPNSELHVFGGYAPQQILELENKKEGFLIKGWAEDVEKVMKTYRVQLAPLRFGAGLKGKIVDAMRFGMPSITTSIGAEGISEKEHFAGKICDSDEDFIAQAIHLYSEKEAWLNAQKNGSEILKNRFEKTLFDHEFLLKIEDLLTSLKIHRRRNFIGQILQHHQHQSTKYLSKWIESKNTLRKNFSPVCYAESDEIRPEYK